MGNGRRQIARETGARARRAIDLLKRFLRGQPPVAIACWSLILVAVLGVIDYLTWEDLAFSIFYLAPVAMATWYGGAGVGIAISIASAAMWLSADIGTSHRHITPFIYTWNCLVRLGFFLIVIRLLTEIRRRLDFEKSLAATDPLTGLANSRVFYERLHAEVDRSRRYGHPFTLLYADIDDFKSVNDSLGHAAGDKALRAVAEAMRRSTRRSDTLARLGGDEFAGLFPETDGAMAGAVAAKLLACVHAAARENGMDLTFSIGAISFDQPMDDDVEMLRRADNLMYEAKKGGKNRIVLRKWPEDGSELIVQG